MDSKVFDYAKEEYAALGIDVEAVLSQLDAIPISIPCWQGDDVAGFEKPDAKLGSGGAVVTGNYMGKARSIAELQSDAEKAFSLIPGKKRFNLHASYGDFFGTLPERNAITPENFAGWADWANSQDVKLDFNPTYFSHPKSDDGFTLASLDVGIREYWIEHGIACRKIAESLGKAVGETVVTNFWIPDGYKDTPINRRIHRQHLEASLDKIFAEKIDPGTNIDAVECKLFGIASESYVVGSHEFYLSYAVKNQMTLCLDAGHFPPTETLADKISSVMQFVPGLLFHLSRGVRWDSDHVVIVDDATQAAVSEVVRGGYLERTAIGLDFFDASINRLATM